MSREEPQINPAAEGISRRKMLKRIGAGTAVAWSAPILTSIHTSAFAASPGCGCPPYDCVTGQQTCPSGCPCAPHHNGGPCICWSSGVCFTGQDTCNTDQDCVNQGFPPNCGDVNPDCGCGGNQTACFDTTGCASGNFTGKAVIRHI
jgi:hypothetical protein